MRIAVVINTAAGSLIGKEGVPEEVAAHLERAGLDALIEPDDGRGLVARIRAACARGVDAVVVGGGDGTIACAAQELSGKDAALGILPLGTMNLLAKDLGLPLTLPEAADALANGVMRAIDVGEVNGRVFLCNSMLGIPARLAVQRERKRGAMSAREYWRLAVAGVRSLSHSPPLTVALDLGQGPRRIRTRALVVVDNDYDEGLGQIMTRSRLDRGELVVYVARALGLLRALRLGFGMAIGHWRTSPGLERHAVKRLVIHSRHKVLRVMNDGEVMMLRAPLRYRVRPKALRVIVPAGEAGRVTADREPEPVRAA